MIGVSVVAIIGAAVITGRGPATFILGPLLLLGLAMIVVRRTWVDTDAGTISRRIFAWPTRTVSWSEAEVVDLQRNHGGQLNLRVKGSSGTILASVLALDAGGERAMQSDQLRLLAEEIERWAPAHSALAGEFRAQAEHVDAGGGARTSPLAERL